ncbi:hypothetical protein K438DRAFT_1761964 [Mycena galopus ATCC 62051]|nr:hypothetical protein K438DRAFT_1761964 [Mycena galopus ATCC 62051]
MASESAQQSSDTNFGIAPSALLLDVDLEFQQHQYHFSRIPRVHFGIHRSRVPILLSKIMGPKKKNGPVVARLNEPTPTPPISIVGGTAAGDQVPAAESSSPARIPSTSKGKGCTESLQRPESKVDDDNDSSSLESETVIKLEVVQDDLGKFDLDENSQDKRPNNISPWAPVNPASSPPPNDVPMDDSSPIKPKEEQLRHIQEANNRIRANDITASLALEEAAKLAQEVTDDVPRYTLHTCKCHPSATTPVQAFKPPTKCGCKAMLKKTAPKGSKAGPTVPMAQMIADAEAVLSGQPASMAQPPAQKTSRATPNAPTKPTHPRRVSFNRVAPMVMPEGYSLPACTAPEVNFTQDPVTGNYSVSHEQLEALIERRADTITATRAAEVMAMLSASGSLPQVMLLMSASCTCASALATVAFASGFPYLSVTDSTQAIDFGPPLRFPQATPMATPKFVQIPGFADSSIPLVTFLPPLHIRTALGRGWTRAFPMADITMAKCSSANITRDSRDDRVPVFNSEGMLAWESSNKMIYHSVNKRLKALDFQMAGENLVKAVRQYFRPLKHPSPIADQLTIHFQNLRNCPEFFDEKLFPRIAMYNTAILVVFVANTNFNLSIWQIEHWNEACRKHNQELLNRQQAEFFANFPPLQSFQNDDRGGQQRQQQQRVYQQQQSPQQPHQRPQQHQQNGEAAGDAGALHCLLCGQCDHMHKHCHTPGNRLPNEVDSAKST